MELDMAAIRRNRGLVGETDPSKVRPPEIRVETCGLD
jgi:nucleoside diphosphate kinase